MITTVHRHFELRNIAKWNNSIKNPLESHIWTRPVVPWLADSKEVLGYSREMSPDVDIALF